MVPRFLLGYGDSLRAIYFVNSHDTHEMLEGIFDPFRMWCFFYFNIFNKI